jgi:hypothetical protein
MRSSADGPPFWVPRPGSGQSRHQDTSRGGRQWSRTPRLPTFADNRSCQLELSPAIAISVGLVPLKSWEARRGWERNLDEFPELVL